MRAQQLRLHKYQERAVKFLLERQSAGLFASPGSGKTAVVLEAVRRLKEQGLVSKVLVLAPLRVAQTVWTGEVTRWARFNGLRVSVLHGPKKDKALEAEADICVCNYEGLDWLLQSERVPSFNGTVKRQVNLARWRQLGFDTLVLDELSKLKHTSTQRFKLLRQVLPTFQRRWGLTGSPASNGLMDLFGQLYVLDMGRSLGPYITHFRNEYFVQGFNHYEWTLRAGAEQRIYERIAPVVLRLDASDYLELPELVNHYLEVRLPDPARRVYREMENELLTQVEENRVMAANAAVASGKCRQIANGAIYLQPELGVVDDPARLPREWRSIHDAKLDALEELVGELQGEPLFVLYEFQHDLAKIQERLPRAVHLAGSRTKVQGIIDDWNAGRVTVLLAHPGSAGHGLNLQHGGCGHLCWFSATWDLELYQQATARVHRQGNKASRVISHHLVATGTLDEVVIGALADKAATQNHLLEALKRLAKQRK